MFRKPKHAMQKFYISYKYVALIQQASNLKVYDQMTEYSRASRDLKIQKLSNHNTHCLLSLSINATNWINMSKQHSMMYGCSGLPELTDLVILFFQS